MASDNEGCAPAVPEETGEIEGKCCCLDFAPHENHAFVYVLVFEREIVKIGRSENPSARVAQLVGICSLPVIERYVFAVYDAEVAEADLLKWYEEYRINDGEWFVIPEEARADIRHMDKFMVNGSTYWPYCAHDKTCKLCEAIEAL